MCNGRAHRCISQSRCKGAVSSPPTRPLPAKHGFNARLDTVTASATQPQRWAQPVPFSSEVFAYLNESGGFRLPPSTWAEPEVPTTDSPSLLSEPGLGAEPGEGGHAFEDAPAIGETPCRLKPRDDGTRAPGGRWICGGFLRPGSMLSVRFAFALDRRRSFEGAGVQRLLGSGARRLDIRANPMRHYFAATVLAVQSRTLGSCSSRTN